MCTARSLNNVIAHKLRRKNILGFFFGGLFFLVHLSDFDSFKEDDDTDLLLQNSYSAVVLKAGSRNPKGSIAYNQIRNCRFKIVHVCMCVVVYIH